MVEQAALAWLESAGWTVKYGLDIAPGEPAAERGDYGQVILEQSLRDALGRPNPALPAEALEDAFRRLLHPEGADLLARNRAVHRLLVDGVTVEVRTRDGEIRGAQVRVAVEETLRAAALRRSAEEPGRFEAGLSPGGELGDRRIGVVWHAQCSGKSLTMAFDAGRIIREPAMENPTDKQDKATQTVLEQAEVLCEGWALIQM
jgi:type I site-specific restriction-modification system R (restriction) subunit